MLVWCDLETTGLDPQVNSLLEIAAIVTDDKLVEVARFERVVYWEHAQEIVDDIARLKSQNAPEDYGSEYFAASPHFVHSIVYSMHRKNGLWGAVVRGTALATVDREFSDFLKQNAVQTYQRNTAKEGEEPKFETRIDQPQLAGSTIGFDRSFINAHLPRAAKQLHYRSIDVSSFNETGRRFWPELWKSRPRKEASDQAHRGMADIEESLAVYKHYLSRLVDNKFTPEFG